MPLYLEYSVILKADNAIKGLNGASSTSDSIQQQSSFNNSGTDKNAVVKRLDVMLLPSLPETKNREVIIDLSSLSLEYIRILHIKSESQFLYALEEEEEKVKEAPLELTKVLFIDKGNVYNPTVYAPQKRVPKYLRISNPLIINGGGDGQSVGDIPIYVSITIVSTKYPVS